jgi:hypothetical protein
VVPVQIVAETRLLTDILKYVVLNCLILLFLISLYFTRWMTPGGDGKGTHPIMETVRGSWETLEVLLLSCISNEEITQVSFVYLSIIYR